MLTQFIAEKKLQKRHKILIIDDDKDIVELVKISLKELNCDFTEAYNGRDGLRKIDEELPDLILLDIVMPEMNGFQVCKQIRTNLYSEAVQIIMLTAEIDEKKVIKGLKAGANDYIKKPFNREELYYRVMVGLENTMWRQTATLEPITQLKNITFLHLLMEAELEFGMKITIVIVDIGCNSIREKYGNVILNETLVKVGKLLESLISPKELNVVAYSEGLFTILISSIDNQFVDIAEITKKIRDTLASCTLHKIGGNLELNLAASVKMVDDSMQSILERTQYALELAKHGRNRIVTVY